MTDAFSDWNRSEFTNGAHKGSLFKKGKMVAASGGVFFGVDGAMDGKDFANALIHFVGETLDSSFYQTWNSTGNAKLYRDGDQAILAVISLARDDDDYGPQDTPTIAWAKKGDEFVLVASKDFRDTKAAELAGIAWPESDDFSTVTVQWGE
ncbi:MAG: hypothetical protein DRJ42_03995 [Deltaproteobacteria bacterium]|nr:MAG: hypothetical protein DRJ42_03995 [Deltaproteobacteria bacterium]